MKFKNIIYFFFLSCFIISCNSNKQKESDKTENIKIHYTTGALYCEGIHKIPNSGKKIRVGNWKFYYPNNSLNCMMVYSDDGELLEQKIFSVDSKLNYNFVNQDNVTFENEFESNGNLKKESISKLEHISEPGTDDDPGVEYNVKLKTEKEYYNNGSLHTYKEYSDDELDGLYQIWDSTGNKILEAEYKNGLIVDEKK